jgi:hypothetical protein
MYHLTLTIHFIYPAFNSFDGDRSIRKTASQEWKVATENLPDAGPVKNRSRAAPMKAGLAGPSVFSAGYPRDG